MPTYTSTRIPVSGGFGSLPPVPGTPMSGPGGLPPMSSLSTAAQAPVSANSLSAFGVNLTPPNPIQYTMPSDTGDIKSVLSSVNQAQNDANNANNARYKQLLSVLNGGYGQAAGQLTGGYNSALGSLSNSLANNQTVYNNDAQRATQDALKAASSAQQSGINRGLGNTTIMNSMADQVQRAKNDAFSQLAAQKAKSDNDVYNNIASIYQNKGNAESGLTAQQTGSLGNAIQGRNDIAPSIGDYAGLISGAAQAQNSGGRTTITTVDPLPINSPLRSGGTSSSGGLSGGISSSMGLGGWSSGANGSSTYTSPNGGSVSYGPNAPGNPNNRGGQAEDNYTPPEMHPVAPINLGTPNDTQLTGTPDEVNGGVPAGMRVISGSGPGIDALTGQWSPFARMLVPDTGFA